jgi:hypothetical protein
MNQQQRRYLENRIWRLQCDTKDAIKQKRDNKLCAIRKRYPETDGLSYETMFNQIKSGKAKMKPKNRMKYRSNETILNLVFDFVTPTKAQITAARAKRTAEEEEATKEYDVATAKLVLEATRITDATMLGESKEALSAIEKFTKFCQNL